MKLKINNVEIPVEIEYKNNRNMYLRVKEDGHIHITCPYRTSEKQIEQFLNENQQAIINLFVKMANRYRQQNSLLNSKSMMLLGKELPIVLVEGKYNQCMIKENEVVVVLKKMDQTLFENTVYLALADLMAKEIEKLKGRWDEMLDDYHLPKPHFQIKRLKSKWGSCTPSQALIVMNVRLMHYPIQCLDAVLLHEYVHMIVPNHSKRFYQIIDFHMPDYKQWHAKLK